MARAQLVLVLVLGVTACDQNAESSRERACKPGDIRSCSCSSGSGSQLCRHDSTFGPCACATSVGCGQPGQERACRCGDGRSGSRVCKADGSLSPCLCEGLARPKPPKTAPASASATEPVQTQRCCRDRGTCVAASALPAADRARLGRFECDDVERVCLPDLVARPEEERLRGCRSIGDVEGRCIPDCLVTDADLPRASCATHERCVPCFDPRSGKATGACTLARADAPDEPAVVFGRCCAERGSCVPAPSVPETARSALAAESCDAERELLCLPDTLADAIEVPLASCSAFGRAEGRCLPACLPALANTARAPWSGRASCADAELCVPCSDPLSGADTGACGMGADPGPAEPAFVFATCCGAGGTPQGRCIPRALLPEATPPLAALECSGEDEVCVPRALLAPDAKGFAACEVVPQVAGACLPLCMVDPRLQLGQSSCAGAERCVPCEIMGVSTGACGGAEE